MVAFEGSIAKGRLRVKLDFLVTSANEMVDNMRRARISSGTAKPLVASKTLNDRTRRVNTAVSMSYATESANHTTPHLGEAEFGKSREQSAKCKV